MSDQPFRIGVTYRPRGGGVAWWGAADRGAVRDDAQQIAGFGLDTVRLRLHWESFQPAPQRVGGAAMRVLEQTLDALHANGLRVILGLLPVWEAGGLHLPRWASRPDPVALLRDLSRPAQARRNGAARSGAAPVLGAVRAQLIYESGYHLHPARDLFAEPELVAAQRYLVGEVCGYFGAHPAVAAWQLAEGWDLLRAPAPGAAAERMADLVERVRAAGAGALLLAVSGRSLARLGGLALSDAAQLAEQIGLALDPPLPLPLAGRSYAELAAFTHGAALALLAGRRQLLALDVTPDEPDQTMRAEQLGATLERLWAAGAAGALLTALHDLPEEEWPRPPFDRSARHRTLGLLDAQGRELPAAAVVRAFAAAHHRPPPPVQPLDLDLERYTRAPRQTLLRRWEE